MMLGKYFSLDEFVLSQTATRLGINNRPPHHVVDKLRALVVNVLDPLRDQLGRSIRISSGYRILELNQAIGGARTSQHIMGEACDLTVQGMTPYQVCEEIIRLKLPFDQLIHEFGSWVHVSYVPDGRREVLTAKRVGKKTVYLAGLS
jgi:hypothetical protein